MSSPLPPDLKSDLDAIVETLLYLYTEARRLTKEIAARHGLTGPQLTVVKMLEALGDLPLSRLSEKIRAQNSTVTGIVDRMEREGLVVRTRSVSDRRVVHIQLTDKGQGLAGEVKVEPMVVLHEALEVLTPEETRTLLHILKKVSSQVKHLVDNA